MAQPARRHIFFGSLLAGAVPSGGFGSTASLKALGYKSPNEKLNLAAIGAGGQPAADLRQAQAGVENVTALADVDWARGKESFERFPGAAKYKDFRQMLDKSGKDIDAVVIGTPDHMHTYCAIACMQADAACVALLAEAGADVNRAKQGGETPLMTASRSGNPEVVQILLKHGAGVEPVLAMREPTEVGRP